MPEVTGPRSSTRERRVKAAVWGALAVVLVAVVGAGGRSLMHGVGLPAPAPPQTTYLQTGGDYGAVPDFTLTERSGRSVSARDLAGRFWIADFIFTRCTGSCPILTARMTSLARALTDVPGAGDLRFVSFSVDPDWDTPAVLNRYAASLGQVDARWLFLTGPREELYRLIGEGFRLSVAERDASESTDGDLITHSDRFVLIDPAGRIRGYYHGSDEDSAGALAADLEKLRLEFIR